MRTSFADKGLPTYLQLVFDPTLFIATVCSDQKRWLVKSPPNYAVQGIHRYIHHIILILQARKSAGTYPFLRKPKTTVTTLKTTTTTTTTTSTSTMTSPTPGSLGDCCSGLCPPTTGGVPPVCVSCLDNVTTCQTDHPQDCCSDLCPATTDYTPAVCVGCLPIAAICQPDRP